MVIPCILDTNIVGQVLTSEPNARVVVLRCGTALVSLE